MDTGPATRTLAGPSYQILNVCEPDSRERPDSGSDEPGRSGRPSDAFSCTTAVMADGRAAGLSTAASNWAVVRAGSVGVAWPRAITDPAITIPTAATAPAGTVHLARRPRSKFAAALTGTSRGRKMPSSIRGLRA